MNPISSLPVLPLAESSGNLLLFGVLAVLVAGLGASVVYLFQVVASLRTEVEKLRAQPAATPAPAATPVVVPVPPKAEPAPAPAPVVESRPTPGELAAILAAVHALFGKEARIVALTPAPGSAQLAWSMEGRREVFRSHQIR